MFIELCSLTVRLASAPERVLLGQRPQFIMIVASPPPLRLHDPESRVSSTYPDLGHTITNPPIGRAPRSDSHAVSHAKYGRELEVSLASVDGW